MLQDKAYSQTIISLSWAGYIVSQNASNQKLEITSISASWTVPDVNASSGNGYSSMWIGIGGQMDKTLIQVGTEQDANSGTTTFTAWYELLPDFSIKIPSVKISPGDIVTASITLLDNATNMWSIELRDTTKQQGFNLNVQYNSTRSSGEWIIERPTVNSQVTSLADFGTANFYDCHVTVNNVEGTIGNFTYSKIEMTNHQATELTSISPLNADGAGFTANYRRSG